MDIMGNRISNEKYWLSLDIPGREKDWVEVTKKQWVAVERNCGFHGSREGEPATGGFGSGGVSGRVTYGEKP